MNQTKNHNCYDESVYPPGISHEAEWQNYFFVIPYKKKFIVYLPLKRLAFIANQTMVDFAAHVYRNPSSVAGSLHTGAGQFLESVGFFTPPSISVSSLETVPKFKPAIVVLLVTTSCNFHCVYCYASSGNKHGGVMPLETGYTAIDIACDNAKDSGASDFSLCFHGGGEPTLPWHHFRKMVQYARSRDLPAKISLSTNGYWNGQKRDWVLANIDDISLSFDGIAEIHNHQRPLRSGGNSFGKVFDTIKAMDKKKASYGIRLTVTESTVDMLPQSIEFLCRKTGCSSFQAEPAFDHGRAKTGKYALVSRNRFVKAFLLAYDIAIKHNRTLFYSGARPLSLTSTFCQAPFNALVVSKDGLLTTCYEIFDPSLEQSNGFFFGSLTPHKTIKMDRNKRQSLLDKIKERRKLCKRCFCYWHCAGDCPSKTLIGDEKGHLNFGGRCEINREITKELLIRYICESGGIWRGEDTQAAIFPASEAKGPIIPFGSKTYKQTPGSV